MSAGFNALNGLETLEVILKKVRTALENTGEFKQNIAFPLLKIEAEVRVWTYPKQALDGEAGIVAKVLVGEAPVDQEPTVKVNVGSTTIDTPDKERLDADLEIPGPSVAGGVLVDVRTDGPKPQTRAESINAAIQAALPNKAAEAK